MIKLVFQSRVNEHGGKMESGEPEKGNYDKKKWKKIIDTTQSNYANMIKRLSRKQKVSNFVLIYYSIFLIINTLTAKYFPDFFDSSLAEYFGIILSVVMLAYSLINNSANYAVRISNVEEALNKLKTIKRDLANDNLQECIKKYNKINKNTVINWCVRAYNLFRWHHFVTARLRRKASKNGEKTIHGISGKRGIGY